MRNIGYFTLPVLVGVIMSIRDIVDPELQHYFDVLSIFLSKGQLLIETLPLLSLKVSTLVLLTHLRLISFGARAMLCSLATIWLCQASGRYSILERRLSHTICLGALGVILLFDSEAQWDDLQSFGCAAECVLLVVVWCATSPSALSSRWGLLDGLLVVAWLLGCNLTDLVTSSFITSLSRILRFLKSPNTKSRSDVSFVFSQK